MSRMLLSCVSPSFQTHLRRTATFADYDAIETLVADVVVGNFKYADVTMAFRAVSKRICEAFDKCVDGWCFRFAKLQKQRIHAGVKMLSSTEDSEWSALNEEYYNVTVCMEKLVKRAFGSCTGILKSIIHISKVDRSTYYGALNKTCVLCGEKMLPAPVVEDAEDTRHAPEYAFGHRACQRKHMVAITTGQSCASTSKVMGINSPLFLHKELSAVARLLEDDITTPSITRANVLSRISDWYIFNASLRNVQLPRSTTILVWLRPHSRVAPEDTIYGAFKITDAMVENAVDLMESRLRMLREQSNARKLSVMKKTLELTEACEVELRIWLGKGKTRWRSIEELEGVHESIMASTHIDLLIDSSMKKCGSVHVGTICNTLHLFSQTIDYMKGIVDRATMDWLVRYLTIGGVYGQLGHKMQYVDRAMLSMAINNEAAAHARTLQVVQNMNENSIKHVTTRPCVVPMGSEDTCYINVCMGITKNVTVTAMLTMSHNEVCKFKYCASSEMPCELACRMPPLPPTCGDVGIFMQNVLKLCFSSGAGIARSIALGLVLDNIMFKQMMDTLEENDGPVVSEADACMS